jgi:short-subunit dehydrogenase
MSLRALVTGGSSGIGRATAELLASKGIEVGVLAHDDCGVDEVVNAIAAKGNRAFGLCIDLAVEANVVGLFDRIEAEYGPVDILVNVAGIGLQADVVETEIVDLNRLFAVNYFAAVILSRDAMKCMAGRGRGHIISVSSASAKRALPGMSTYASTKAALHAFSQALRIEARDRGVHVTEVLPMTVRTPFFENAENRSPVPYSLSDAGLVSTPESVAEHIWNAIRRPVDEVYTSRLARLALAIDAAFPSILNRILVVNRRKRLGR